MTHLDLFIKEQVYCIILFQGEINLNFAQKMNITLSNSKLDYCGNREKSRTKQSKTP